nr:IS607 family transposase [Mycobacterium tuberculosis]
MSATIRTARSRSSGGYLLDEPPDMTPSFPRTGVSGHAGAVQWGRTVVCARLSSADQKVDLDRQVVGVTAWATAEQIPVGKVVTEVGSALYGRRRTFLTLLGDPTVRRIVMKRRDRLGRFGFECVQAVLAADGRELVVVDSADVDDDVVGDITEILTSICARLYGKRAAGNRAARAVAAAARAGGHEAR